MDDDEDEVDGFQVGHYSDFGALRDYICRELEAGTWGSRFPTLMNHSDCDGEWSVADCEPLTAELAQIATEMKARSVVPFPSEWQQNIATSIGLAPQNAFESFLDVDGEPVIERVRKLVDTARERGLPILFQ
jgi:hypothetical protein